MKKKNPVIEKAKQEAFNEGFLKGSKTGFEHGKYSACMYFADKFDGLYNVPGIGPKTAEKVISHFGEEFFNEKD